MKIDLDGEIKIENYVLNERTLPKLSEEVLEVLYDENCKHEITTEFNEVAYPFAISSVKSCPMKSAQILDECDNEKEIIEITFDCDENYNFLPGDTIGILPVNDDEEIEFLLECLNLSDTADNSCKVLIKSDTTSKSAKVPIHIPKTEVTCRQLLKYYLNYKSIPKKTFIRSLIKYCDNENEQHFLETLCSKEGSDIYNTLILGKPVLILDLFKICASLHPPMSLLIEHLPRLLPRPYSISNCKSNNGIRIIFSYLLENPGITTKYLRNKMENRKRHENALDYVNLYFRQPSKFRLTEDLYVKNLIMISVGCAIAPFLGFLQQKRYLKEQGLEMGDWYLYGGFKCKSSVIYRNELIEYEKNAILEKYYECLSREENSNFKYVQEAIASTVNNFVPLIENENTVLLVCADGNTISKEIKICIQKSIFGEESIETNKIIKDWIKNGKYIEDVWL